MERNIKNFAKYNNTVPIALSMMVFLAAGTFAASPEIRDDVRNSVISSQATVRSIDNTQLLAVQFDNFDFKLKIDSITEDDKNYYVEYLFQTLILDDSVWQVKNKSAALEVGKSVLAGRDLGDYVAEQLKQVIDYERSYLADTQTIEKQNGATKKVVTTTYSGLIGKFLDPKQEVFPGYDEVVKTPEPTIAAANVSDSAVQSTNGFTEDYIRSIVQNMIEKSKDPQKLSDGILSNESAPVPPISNSVNVDTPIVIPTVIDSSQATTTQPVVIPNATEPAGDSTPQSVDSGQAAAATTVLDSVSAPDTAAAEASSNQ